MHSKTSVQNAPALENSDTNVVPLEHRRLQLGALDLGSNSFHLIIAQETQGRVQVLDKHKEMVRLAAGLDDNNQLSKQALQRALDCLRRFAQRLRPLDAENVRVVGTNTLRKAECKSFLKEAEVILGHKIDIISGREEARLIYLGVCHDLGASDHRRMIIDIGGGSTEIAVGQRFTPATLESFFMGCVSMTQRHFPKQQISNAAFKRAIEQGLVELEPMTKRLIQSNWQSVIGTSGTINAVGDVIAKNFASNTITLSHLNDLKRALCKFGSVDAIDLDGLSDERKAIFPGGVAILIALFQAMNIQNMTTCSSALREGLIIDLLGRQHQDDARDQTVQRLITRFNIDPLQAREVRETAISLLSQVASPWTLTSPRCKNTIGWAAELMEIGMDIAHSGYHKHGAYLIDNMDMPGFSSREQREIGTLVRTHRRKLTLDLFADFDDSLPRLACLLRIAAVLHRNRSHESLPHINAVAKDGKIELTITKQWRRAHPLTVLDLNNEATYLRAINIDLTIATA